MAPADDTLTIHRHTLANGLTLLFEPMPWLRSASLSFLLPVGAITDPVDRDGSAAVLYDWLFRGAGERDSRAFSDALDDLGVRRGGHAGRETSTLTASMLTDAVPEALPLLADVLLRPRLADDEFESARELVEQELASLDDAPNQRLFEILTRAFFRSAHGRSPYGSVAGLAALDVDGVRADYRRRYAPSGTILGVAGGLEWDALVAQVESLFGDWSGLGAELPAVEVAAAERHHVTADSAQVQIGVAAPGIRATDPDWYPHTLAMNVLSGGMGSRLFSEVREKRGLVYSVAAVSRTVRDYGYTLGYAGTTPERADETLSVVLAEFERLRRGVDGDELERARTGILSQLVMQGESSGARAAALVHDQYLRGEPRRLQDIRADIAAVSLDDVNAFLARQPELRPTVVTLGPGGA